MIINYNVSGSDRKQLVAAIAEHTGENPNTSAHPVLPTRSAVSPSVWTARSPSRTTAPPHRSSTSCVRRASRLKTLWQTASQTMPTKMWKRTKPAASAISMPRSLFTDSSLENLKALIAAKGNLIKKALGVDDLPIEVTDEKVSFPWFPAVPTPEELKAYDTFICKLCEMARNAKRVVAKEKETDNDKYAFRCFLLRLGFIGAEFKTERKILLRNLVGTSAFRSGQPKEVEVCE